MVAWKVVLSVGMTVGAMVVRMEQKWVGKRAVKLVAMMVVQLVVMMDD